MLVVIALRTHFVDVAHLHTTWPIVVEGLQANRAFCLPFHYGFDFTSLVFGAHVNTRIALKPILSKPIAYDTFDAEAPRCDCGHLSLAALARIHQVCTLLADWL